MEINVVELIVQAGGLGLAALLVILAARYGGKYLADLISRLMDNLDQQNKNYQASIKVQAEVAANLRSLCDKMDHGEVDHSKQAQDTVEAQAEVAKVLTDLGGRLQAHETRAQKRHEQQSDQSSERHAELIGVLRHLNGK